MKSMMKKKPEVEEMNRETEKLKPSKKKKSQVDEISRETQRLVSNSHVRLPYHKPKQKSLKDFLNRSKISTEFQASITGSKKLLHKAWEFIENKEQNVEKFYNEDCSDNEELSTTNDNNKDDQNMSLNDNDDNNCAKEPVSKQKFTPSEMSEDEDDYQNDLSINSIMSSFNDEEENSRDDSSLNFKSDKLPTQIVSTQYNNENLKANLDSDSEDSDNSHYSIDDDKSNESITKQFIDDEAEISSLDSNSDNENNLPNFIDDSDDEGKEEFLKKKKRKLVLLSDSEEEDNTKNDNNESDKETNLTPNCLNALFNETENENISTQQLMNLCSGEFLTQESNTEENDDFDDGFDSEVPLNGIDLNADEDFEMPKLTSVKDFFEDEAELSESDWSSDDEEHLADAMDNLEEEEGDKDKLDENIVKDGLDKIYMRQLLDDDQQQVTALKEMLLEDGDLHSDSGRKRKFQWDEYDENDDALKKPLFSDNEDNVENELSDDETEHWMKERFKRESYLSQNTSDEDEINENEKSINILQTSVPVIKKTHIIKYTKCESQQKSSTNNFETIQSTNDNNKSNLTSVTTVIASTTEVKNIGVKDFEQTNLVSSESNSFIKGSFMRRSGDSRMATKLLYMNKKLLSTNNDEINIGKYEDKREIKSMTTIIAKASSNPFAYLLRDDKKQEIKNIVNLPEKVLKNTKTCHYKSSQPLHETKIHQKPVNSILKQLD